MKAVRREFETQCLEMKEIVVENAVASAAAPVNEPGFDPEGDASRVPVHVGHCLSKAKSLVPKGDGTAAGHPAIWKALRTGIWAQLAAGRCIMTAPL